MTEAEDHARDYEELRRLGELREQIRVFITDAPSGVNEGTLTRLAHVGLELKGASDQIVRRWG